MKKLYLFIVYAAVFMLLLPMSITANAESEKTEADNEEYNEFGIKKGTTVYGIDISEFTEEELQYVPEAWLDGVDEGEHTHEAEEAENYEPEGLTSSLQSKYPDVNSYIEKMNPVEIEYEHKSVFPRFNYRGGFGAVEGVVAHETANNTSTIRNEIDYMTRNYHNAFVHAFVDHNHIIEIHPSDYGAWGAGPIANQRFVHVELTRVHTFDQFARSMNNYAHYIASILKQYDLGVTSAELSGKGSLWSHRAVSEHLGGTNHVDPHGYFEKWGYSWYDFTKLVKKKYDALSTVRISGDSRYKTAVRVSQEGWNTSNTVILARGDEYADALAGVPLAAKHNAPLLLTQSNKFTQVTKDEIKRLKAKTVYLLGGESAISKTVESQLKNEGLTVNRISGTSRTGTAVEIAKLVGGKEAILVNGYNFPDALSVASYAGQKGMPILLTQSTKFSPDTQAALGTLNISNILVVGGTQAVSPAVVNELPKSKRISGSTRYATAVEVAKHFNVGAKEYYVATGKEYPDALSSAALAAKNKTGVLLVNNGVPWQVRDFLQRNKVEEVTVIGGQAIVAPGVQRKLEEIVK